ncbi:MAG: hypothetical protein WC998_02535 [Candidatus Paceibacterota bacterium]|jgi:hypothetical protein
MKKQLLSLSIILFAVFLIPLIVSADSVTATLTNITGWIVTVSLVVASLMYVVAGFMWMSDAGNAERAKLAKSIIVSTTIGLVVILMANGLMSIVQSLVVK